MTRAPSALRPTLNPPPSAQPSPSPSPRPPARATHLLVRATSGWVVPGVFFVATVVSTLFIGGLHGMAFWAPELASPGAAPAEPLEWARRLLVYGSPFSFTVLLILFTHEMGHYVTARRYRVQTTLPVFLPFPSIVGTVGAFIIIKSRFPHRKALIDVGLAGPFAGFVVAVPAAIVGAMTSRLQPALDPARTLVLGEPLLFQGIASWIWPHVPEGHTLMMSPVALAAWFGLLMTAINLLPMGQLDGGHASYALFGRYAHRISRAVFLLLLPLSYFGPTWLVWAVLAFVLGFRRPHPRTLYDELPLPTSRKIMGLLALAIFVLCFTPEPVVFNWSDLF